MIDLSDLEIPDLTDHESVDIDEKRKQWLNQRRGLFTASEFYKLMTALTKPDVLPVGAISYVRKKVAESLSISDDSEAFVSPAMQWGIDNEHAAVDAFVAATGLEVQACKAEQEFIQLGALGGTPDGIIIDSDNSITGIEIKCPVTENHILNILNVNTADELKTNHLDYYWQVQGLIMITGADYWYFVSYDPRMVSAKLKLHIVKIERAEADIELLNKRLNLAINLKNELIVKINQLSYDC